MTEPEYRVRWGPGGPPTMDPEWAEIAAALRTRITGKWFDLHYSHDVVPLPLAGPRHPSRS